MDFTMLYLNNKYSRWYQNIIKRAIERVQSPDEYYERHHIIPKSLGGTDSKENIVKLTAREHFICHLLLTKMTTGSARASMSYAAWQMTNRNNRPRYSPTSRMYEFLRIQLSKTYTGRKLSDETKKKIGEHSKKRKPMLGKKHSDEAKEKISRAAIGKPRPKNEETKRKMSETWKKIAPDRAGGKNPMFGKRHKEETRSKIGQANAGEKNGMFNKYKDSPIVTCPHCRMTGKEGPNFIRWHFDDCKKNDQRL